MGEMTDPSKGVTGPRRNRQGRQRMDHLVVNKILERERESGVYHMRLRLRLRLVLIVTVEWGDFE